MSGQPLPAVLQTKTIERPEVEQDINTDLLFPVSFNQNQAKFVFDRKGILDSNSQLQVASTVVNSTTPTVDTGAFYPSSVGAVSLIKRAYLEIGGKRISDLQDVAHYTTWERTHWSNEYRKGVAFPKQGGNDVFVGSASKTIAANSADAIRSRGFSAPYGTIGRVSSDYASNATAIANVGQQQSALTETKDRAKRLITTDETTTPTMSIGLSQLIPFLVGVQLPLFAIREEVSLHIVFNTPDNNNSFCLPATDTAGVPNDHTTTKSTIVEGKFLIMADYLFFPSLMGELSEEIMNRGGYDIPYCEVLEQQNYTSYSVGDFRNDYQIQVGGKMVKWIVVQKEESAVNLNNLGYANYGNYNSRALREGCQYQFKIDSQNVYSLPLKNTSLQKTEADAVKGNPLVLNNYIYTWKNQTDGAGTVAADDYGMTDRLVNTISQHTESGSQNWFGLKIENSMSQGRRISNQPIIYTEEGTVYTADDNTSRKVRFWIGTQKMLNISNGLTTVIF